MNDKTPYSVRLPEDLRAELKRVAAAEDRSLHSLIVHLLRNAVVQRVGAGELSHRAGSDHLLRPSAATPDVTRQTSVG